MGRIANNFTYLSLTLQMIEAWYSDTLLCVTAPLATLKNTAQSLTYAHTRQI